CGNGPRCWGARSASGVCPARARRSPCGFHFEWQEPVNEPIMKILIVDDHAVVRKRLRHILADKFRRAEFGEARNAHEALTRIWREKWDVVVLDITMPGRSGLEVLREIKHGKPKLPVLVLSMQPEHQFALRVLKS